MFTQHLVMQDEHLTVPSTNIFQLSIRKRLNSTHTHKKAPGSCLVGRNQTVSLVYVWGVGRRETEVLLFR